MEFGKPTLILDIGLNLATCLKEFEISYTGEVIEETCYKKYIVYKLNTNGNRFDQ